jgi:ribonuclease HI
MVRVRSRRDIGPLLRSKASGAARRRQARAGRQTKVVKTTKRKVTTGPPKSNRVFDQEKYGITAITDESSGLRRLATDPQSIVVAIGGSCKDNGFPSARAASGVFFSHSAHDLNRSGEVPSPSPQTSNYAELYVAMQALEIIHQLIIAGEDLTHVIMKTDSSYLALGLSKHVWKWTLNGFRNWKGQPLLNGRAFKYLHEKVVLLEQGYGIHVSFCQVGREFNQKADGLARAALL